MQFPKGFEVNMIGSENTTHWKKVLFQARGGKHGGDISRRESLISQLGGDLPSTELAKYVSEDKVASFSACMLHKTRIVLMPPGGISILHQSKNQGFATQVQSILVHVARVAQYTLFAATVSDKKLQEELIKRGYIFLPELGAGTDLDIFIHSTALSVGYIIPESAVMPTGSYEEKYEVVYEH